MRLIIYETTKIVVAVLTLTFSIETRSESFDSLQSVILAPQTRSFNDPIALSEAIEVAPRILVSNPAGSSPSVAIKRIYGFGASDSPSSYASMEKKILDLNGVDDPRKFPTGDIIVPDLPVLSSKPLSPKSDAKIVVVHTASENMSAESHDENVTPDIPTKKFGQVVIPGAISETLEYSRIAVYPDTVGASIKARADELGISVLYGAEVGIEISDPLLDCPIASSQILTKDTADKIQNLLSRGNDDIQRFLVIFDTGWPSYESELLTLKRLRVILDEVRKSLKIKDSDFPKFDPSLEASSFMPLTNNHACLIHKSLEEFSNLDLKKRVTTLYIPLRPGQFRSKDLFRELITIGTYAKSINQSKFDSTPVRKDLQNAISFTDESMNTLWTLNTPWAANDNQVRLFEPLVNSLMDIFGLYSDIESSELKRRFPSRFWYSFSWNFAAFANKPSLPLLDNYMVFAAAGNDKSDFVIIHRLYASEATENARVFGVMNSDEISGALTCGSAVFAGVWSEDNPISNIVSFPGRLISGANVSCPGFGGGTSFSTPRLAWLAAALDSAQGDSSDNWKKSLTKKILTSRIKIASDTNAAPVNLKLLLQ